jgi:cytidylate kinase
MGIRSEDVKHIDEKAPGFFDRVFSNKHDVYLNFMEAVVYEVAREGEGVIIGHGSQMLLRDFGCALHVRVHASAATRVSRIMRGKGLGLEAAEKLLRKEDHEKSGFFRFAFHLDWNDPSLYDLVINTEKMSEESAARLVIETARSGEISSCSLTAIDAMDRLALEKKIHAALLWNNVNLSLLYIEVPEKGVARISGFSYNEEEKNRIIDIMREVPGISDVRAELAVSPPSAD